MKRWLFILFSVTVSLWCRADSVAVAAPTPSGPVGNPYDTATLFPFLIKQISLSSMRYQQVYNAPAFTNLDPRFIYITVFGFRLDPSGKGSFPWTITNMQINLSTTQRAADNLSTNFAENVGTDDTIVFGPGRHDFPLSPAGEGFQIQLDRPFRYNPALGNLLLDVRIFNGAGPFDMNTPQLDAQSSPTDECSRVWATNVTAAVASAADTTALAGGVQLSGVPSLQIQVESVYGTNRPVVRWPAQPSVFVPQISPQFGSNAVWQTITNGILGSPDGPDRAIYLDTPPPGTAGFYRLVWEQGQPAQPATVKLMLGKAREALQTR